MTVVSGATMTCIIKPHIINIEKRPSGFNFLSVCTLFNCVYKPVQEDEILRVSVQLDCKQKKCTFISGAA